MTEQPSMGTPRPPRVRMINPIHLLKRFWFVAAFAVVLLIGGGYWLKNAFHDRGYAPVQPIAYSHKQHAGDLKIDCQFCHSQAAHGRQAGIPDMGVCMGCHTQVATDKPEIQKLTEIAEKGTYDENGVAKVGGVVHWKRVHKLPDHVYFTHQWHVQAGVSCQTCHGQVEDMVTLRQHATLNMGWCLDCHRKTNYVGEREGHQVGTADNAATLLRQEADPVVGFLRHGQHATATSGHADPAPKPADVRQVDRLKRLIAAHPDLQGKPQWQVADLPETHRQFYGSDMLMNAQTQCSTCHQ